VSFYVLTQPCEFYWGAGENDAQLLVDEIRNSIREVPAEVSAVSELLTVFR